MLFLILNGVFVGGLLGYINAINGNEINELYFWLIMSVGIIINFCINLTRHL